VAAAVQEDEILSNWRKQTAVPFAVAGFLTLIIAIIVFLIAQQRAREHKRSQQRLAVQKERLDTAVNNMTQGLLLFDTNGRIVVCNERYLAMYGLSAEVVRPGCTLRELIEHRKACGSFNGDVDEYCSRIERDIAQGRITELSIKTPDGRAIKIVNKPLENGGGVVTHEDITERQMAEIERDRNRQFLDLILENVPVPVFVKEVAGRSFILVNRAIEEFWGVPRGEIIGHTVYKAFAERDADSFTVHDDQTIRSPDGYLYSEREVKRCGNATDRGR
jgi:PAS domain S-box-containing protein